MNLRDENPSTRPGLEGVLLRYYHSVDEGKPLSPQELITAHPDLASELEAFFSGQDLLGCLAPGSPQAYRARKVTVIESPPELGELVADAEVGRGGIGIVYRVHDARLGRDLAVKVLQERYRDDSDAHRRFIEEAQI